LEAKLMKFNLGVRAGKNRQLVAMVAILGWALGSGACSSSGGSTGTGGSGAGGRATGGAGGRATGGTTATGTGGSGVGGGAGSGPDAGSSDATDAPANNDATAADTAPLPCIPDGGDASGDCCPDDPLKTQPGQCGCGMIDFDYDNDGIADCNDPCPLDLKPGPGICGCGVPDTDTDNDGTADCNDGCPQNGTRLTPGLCGCALPDTAAPSCLAHRYSFNDGPPSGGGAGGAGGAGGGGGTTTVRDSVGTANGIAVNVALSGTGSLTLAGGQSDQYVSLPSGIISALGNSATFEGWINWTGAGAWQRVFDFGDADPTMPGVQGTGSAFVFLSPLSGAGVALFTVNTVGLTEVMAPQLFPMGSPGAAPHHFAAVVDASGPSARLYIDGTLVATTPLISTLSGLHDVNNWLGRSQFVTDPEFGGTYYEFRIHSAAMTQAQIAASIAAGPDTLP
jgi:Concanavalin A-like lectin/glucanases superfamily